MNAASNREQTLDALTEDAAQRVRQALLNAPRDAVVIVDFDETLWLRNSTEEYLRSLRPRPLAYLILVVLDALRPWRILGGTEKQHFYRDWLRTLICTVLMPWSLTLWRRRAAELAAAWRNDALLSILSEFGQHSLRIATIGIDAVVLPLLRHIDPRAELIAAGTLWSGHRIRRLGKAASIKERYGHELIGRAIVITDSKSDADLLDICYKPILVQWPNAGYYPALSDSYVPFLYTQRAKRPGANYMLYGVLLEDVALLWLSFAWSMTAPGLGCIALLLLHLSLWAVYEIGYVENDARAAQHEVSPKVYEQSLEHAARMKPALAWLAATLFAVPGILLLVGFNRESLAIPDAQSGTLLFSEGLVLWLIYLVVVRFCYWIYNRMDVSSRTVLYAALQLLRTVGYRVLLLVNLVGVMALLSLVLGRWIKYLVYRDMGSHMREDQRLLSLLLFIILLIGATAVDPLAVLTWQAAATLGWLSLYAHRRLRQFISQVRIAQI